MISPSPLYLTSIQGEQLSLDIEQVVAFAFVIELGNLIEHGKI